MHALLAGILAQTCVALLPPPRAEIEWFRDGRPYARDVPLRASRTERVYRRHAGSGAATERTLSCVTTNGVTYLAERIGETTVRLPVPLAVGGTGRVGGAAVRRIEAPADAGGGALWYTVSSPGISVYALRSGAGIVEVRLPAAAGGFSVLRAVVREPGPDPAAAAAAAAAAVRAEADSQRVLLERRIGELERTVAQLTDSIGTLLARHARFGVRQARPEVSEFFAIDVHLARDEFDHALALLSSMRRTLLSWRERVAGSAPLDAVNARLREVLGSCLAARERPRTAQLRCQVEEAAR